MECKLDKNKIEAAIVEAAITRATDSGLFTIKDNVLVAKNNMATDIKPLTEEQLSLLDEIDKHKDSIQGVYKDIYEENPLLFLHEIAEQAQSSDLERDGAISAVTEDIVNLANRVFPDVNRKSPEQQFIDKMNSEFTRDVAKLSGRNTWTISAPEELIVKYLLQEPGSFPHVTDYLRAKYLSQFTSTSLNLLGDDIWLNHPALEDPTVKQMLTFMKKLNPNARVGEFDNLDQPAVSLIRDFVIMVKRGGMIDELPHEVSHFFVELLPDDNPLKIEMMKKILDMPIYNEVYRKYKDNLAYQKNGKPDIDKIKREAIAQQISEYIKAAYRNEADTKYGKKRGWLRDITHRFFKFLRRIFHINSPGIYTEPLMDANSPFVKAANQITNLDISNLNVKKVMSVYDSIFFDAIEEEIPETFEAGDIVKSMWEFTKAIKGQIAKVFAANVRNKNMTGLIEQLEDPANKDYNRLFAVISRFGVAGDLLKDIMDNPPSKQDEYLLPMLMVAQRMGDAYRSMEVIPTAIDTAIKKMEKEKTIEGLLNNLTELQAYGTFSESFKTITREFESMLSYIREKWPSETAGMQIYNTMLENMSNVQTKFNVANNNIMDRLTKHLSEIMDKWTDSYLATHREELIKNYGLAQSDDIKKFFMDRIYGHFTSGDQFMRALIGNFPQTTTEMIHGQKIDIQRLRDITYKDKLIFITSSPTLMADPFISNAMGYFYDKYAEYQMRGDVEAKRFVDSLAPMYDRLGEMGLSWYQINNLLHNTQSTFSPFGENQEHKRRVFQSGTFRFKFQFDKQRKYSHILDLQKELSQLKSPTSTATPEEIDAKNAEVETARKDFNEWLAKVSYRPFTDDYYEKLSALQEGKGDNPIYKQIKTLRRDIEVLVNLQYEAFILGMTYNQDYEDLSMRIARLQDTLVELERKLPETDKELWKIADEIYEVDKVRTARLKEAHKDKTVQRIVSVLIDEGLTGGKSRAALEQEVGEKYDLLYTINTPKQEFYDRRTALFDELGKILSTNIEFKAMKDRMELLSKKERMLIKQLRDFRGDVNMSSLKYLPAKDEQGNVIRDGNGMEIPLATMLKEIELEIDMLRKRSSLYSQVLSNDELTLETRQNILSMIDMMTGFALLAENSLSYKIEDVKSAFSDYFNLTDSQATQILSAIQKAHTGDNTELQNLKNLTLSFKTASGEAAFNLIRDRIFNSIADMNDMEENMYRAFSALRRSKRSDEAKMKMEGIFQDLQALYQNGVSYQYGIAMEGFMRYFGKYITDDSYMAQNKDIHKEKFDMLGQVSLAYVADIEGFLGDGLFEEVIGYMKAIEKHQKDDDAYPLSELIDYYLSIHKRKSYWIDGQPIETWTPISYVRSAVVNPELTESTAPRFLTQSKVRDKFVVQKMNDLHEDVLSGKEKANVDMNGMWLPKEEASNTDYWNEDYAALKEGKTEQDREAFKLLEATKLAYLKRQQETLPEGKMLDLLVPPKYVDDLEWKIDMLAKGKNVVNYIRNIVPFLNSKKAEIENQNYLEDIAQATIKNPDIYTGLALSEEAVKLRSARTVPIERTSADAIASVAMFFEDINEYTAKTIVEPLFKSFRDVFKYSNEKYPQSNANRAELFQDMYDLRILDKMPKSALNHPTLAKISQVILTLTGWRLLMDIPGGIINLASGELQMLIEVNISKSAAKYYAQAGWLAAKWLKDYDYDSWNQADWGLATQTIAAFNMIPSAYHISTQMSKKAVLSSIHPKIMAPRSEGEKLMAIQTGLSVLLSQSFEFRGQTISPENLYELGEDGIIKLKDEYKDLEEDWNPINGKEVVKVRRAIMQFYTMLQGNYYKTNKAWLSYIAAGKWTLALKNWFASNFLRRMHGRVMDPFLQRERVGTHFALISLLGNMASAAYNRDSKKMTDYWNLIAKNPQEMLAIRRSLAEMFYTFLFGMIVLLGFGYDYDDKDKNRKLREMAYMKQLMLMILMRVQGEVGTFIPLPVWGLGYMEIKRAILDPIALPKTTVDNIAGLGKLGFLHMLKFLGMPVADKELYYQNKKGYGYNMWGLGAIKDKGDSKFLAMFYNTLGYTGYTFEPAAYMQTYNQMQNRIK